MVVADIMFEEFFCRPIPREGFVINPHPTSFGLIDEDMYDKPALHGYAITMDGNIVVPELRPKQELKN
jgi:hypothetical protein